MGCNVLKRRQWKRNISKVCLVLAGVPFVVWICLEQSTVYDNVHDHTRNNDYGLLGTRNSVSEASLLYKGSNLEAAKERMKKRRERISDFCASHPLNPNVFLGRSTSVISPQNKFLHCPVTKAASTFWFRFLQALNRTSPMQSPYSFPIAPNLVTTAYKLRSFHGIKARQEAAASSFRNVFVRDPYKRMFSAYVDKVFAPNPTFWQMWGVKAIQAFRREKQKPEIRQQKQVQKRKGQERVKGKGSLANRRDLAETVLKKQKQLDNLQRRQNPGNFRGNSNQNPEMFRESRNLRENRNLRQNGKNVSQESAAGSEIEEANDYEEGGGEEYDSDEDVDSCGHDVTFAEVMSYVNRNNVYVKDIHFMPVSRTCPPCGDGLQFHHVGKMETFEEDVVLLAREMNLTIVPYLQSRQFRVDYARDAIEDSITSPFSWMEEIEQCMTKEEAGRRVWRKLQIRGLISRRLSFPYPSDTFANVTAEQFIDVAFKAHLDSTDRAELKRQKRDAFLEAYSSLGNGILEKLVEVFKTDFALFEYEERPKEIFETEVDFTTGAFDWNTEWVEDAR